MAWRSTCPLEANHFARLQTSHPLCLDCIADLCIMQGRKIHGLLRFSVFATAMRLAKAPPVGKASECESPSIGTLTGRPVDGKGHAGALQ